MSLDWEFVWRCQVASMPDVEVELGRVLDEWWSMPFVSRVAEILVTRWRSMPAVPFVVDVEVEVPDAWGSGSWGSASEA